MCHPSGGREAKQCMSDAEHVLARLLSPVEVRATVPATPEAVFAVLSDPETYPEVGLRSEARPARSSDEQPTAVADRTIHRTGSSSRCTSVRSRGSSSSSSSAPARAPWSRFRERVTGALGLAMPLLRGPIFLRNKASLDSCEQRFEPLIVPL